MNLPPDTIVLVRCELFTAFGFGIDPTWNAMLEDRHGFTPITRFHSDALAACSAATAPEEPVMLVMDTVTPRVLLRSSSRARA